MLRSLHLKDVGPAPSLDFEFAPRLNLLTGDNGLGKSFVLEVIWWMITTTWVGEVALPRSPRPLPRLPEGSGYGIPEPRFGDRGWQSAEGSGGTLDPRITGALAHRTGDLTELDVVAAATYEWQTQQWKRTPYELRRATPGFKAREDKHDESEFRPQSLVVFVRTDGSFAVWDPYRATGGIKTYPDAALVFDAREVWEGKFPTAAGDRRVPPICRGLIEDWRSWQKEGSSLFESMRRVLLELSEPDSPLVAGLPARVKLGDAREIPTLATAYGEVPVTLASAAVRRILALAYLLVWSWNEHVEAGKLSRRKPTGDMVILLDEVELHLHPQWQRRVLPALLRAISTFAPDVAVQVTATTHSPLVLASLEPVFAPALDALFTLDLTPGPNPDVRLERVTWRRFGDANAWLTSEIFDLGAAWSVEAEQTLREAIRALRDPATASPGQVRAIDERLRAVLGDTEPFWARWAALVDAKAESK